MISGFHVRDACSPREVPAVHGGAVYHPQNVYAPIVPESAARTALLPGGDKIAVVPGAQGAAPSLGRYRDEALVRLRSAPALAAITIYLIITMLAWFVNTIVLVSQRTVGYTDDQNGYVRNLQDPLFALSSDFYYSYAHEAVNCVLAIATCWAAVILRTRQLRATALFATLWVVFSWLIYTRVSAHHIAPCPAQRGRRNTNHAHIDCPCNCARRLYVYFDRHARKHRYQSAHIKWLRLLTPFVRFHCVDLFQFIFQGLDWGFEYCEDAFYHRKWCRLSKSNGVFSVLIEIGKIAALLWALERFIRTRRREPYCELDRADLEAIDRHAARTVEEQRIRQLSTKESAETIQPVPLGLADSVAPAHTRIKSIAECRMTLPGKVVLALCVLSTIGFMLSSLSTF